MQRRQKLLLSVVVGGLTLFYGTTIATALTSQEIAKIALDSTTHLGFTDAKGNRWTGSGFVIRDGHIATNYHVVDNMWIGGAKLVGKEEIYPVETILGSDKGRDLAIIKVVGIDAPALPLGDSDTVQIGDKVYVVGNPRGLEGLFSEGVISAILGDPNDKFFQLTAPISQGSSGGPVFNENGEVIGVSFVTLRDGQNLNFVTPVNYLKSLANIPVTLTPVQPQPSSPKIDPLPVEPQPTKPQMEEPSVEPEPVKPKINPSSVQPQPTKSQADQSSVKPNPSNSQVNLPKPEPPKPRPRHDMLDKGIRLYEQAKYNDAIKILSSVIQKLEDSEQQAAAYLYLGCSKWGAGEGNHKVREQFQESIRHNPDQELPPRIGADHPIFGGLLEEVRRKLTGELTVISLLPQTEIWIEGNNIDRKMLGTGIVKCRLLTGDYIVEGIYAGGSKRRTVTIELSRHKEIDFDIPPIIIHDSPAAVSAGEVIPLALNLISSKAPQQVTINYKTYARDGNKLEQQNQEMRLWEKKPTSSTWIYKVGLPAQKYVGSIEYHVKIEYGSRLTFRQPEAQYDYYQITIIDSIPPTINLIDPPEGAKIDADQQLTIRAEVTDNIAVKEVHVHLSSGDNRKLTEEGSSGIYTVDIPIRNMVVFQYHLIASDEAGNESKSVLRQIEIQTATDTGKSENEVGLEPEKIRPREESQEVEPLDPSPTMPADLPEESPLMSSTYPMYQGIWVSAASNNSSLLDWEGDKMFRIAYLREGKYQPTLGAQLEFSHPGNTNVSAMVQWGPAFGKRNVGLTFLGGITKYKGQYEKPHMTPILGAGLRLYPGDKIAINATSSIKFRSDFDTTSLYHYEIGVRIAITHRLNLRAGFSKLCLGSQNVPSMQVGLGYTF